MSNPRLFNQESDTEPYIRALRQYISKNTFFPEFFADCDRTPEHQLKINRLRDAINNGNLADSIFDDPHAKSYVIYLIEKRQIDYWDGMSAYTYLMAIDDYGKENVKVKTLFDKDGNLTSHGDEYIKQILKDKMRVQSWFSRESLIELFRETPGLSRYVIHANFDIASGDKQIEHLTAIDRGKISFLLYTDLPHKDGDTSVSLIIPSYSIMNAMFKSMAASLENSPPMLPLPIFGNVSPKTIAILHKQNRHPLALRHEKVKSNLRSPHNISSSAIFTWTHDLVHVHLGNHVAEINRRLIFDELLPHIDMLAKEDSSELSKQFYTKLYEHLADFDISSIDDFTNTDQHDLLHQYLMACAGRAVYDVASDNKTSNLNRASLFLLTSIGTKSRNLPETRQKSIDAFMQLIRELPEKIKEAINTPDTPQPKRGGFYIK